MLLVTLLLLTIDPEEAKLLDLINAYRIQNNAPRLNYSEKLQDAARWMSYDVARTGAQSHTDSIGRGLLTRLNAFDYPVGFVGENINGGSQTAQGSFDGFKNNCDPDTSGTCTYAHRKNMLDPKFLEVGIGRAYVPTAPFRYYWTVDFGNTVGIPPVVTPPVVVPPVVIPSPPVDPPKPDPAGNVISSSAMTAPSSGSYLITVSAPYGFRLLLDFQPFFERWGEYGPGTYKIVRYISEGQHAVNVEHYGKTNVADIKPVSMTWTKN